MPIMETLANLHNSLSNNIIITIIIIIIITCITLAVSSHISRLTKKRIWYQQPRLGLKPGVSHQVDNLINLYI